MPDTKTSQQAYRFALDPTPSQARGFSSHAGGARFAYNWGLARTAAALDAYAAEKATGVDKPATKIPSHFDLCKAWTAHKDAHRDVPDEQGRTLAWVGENFVGTYQAALRDAAGAWKNFFASRRGARKGRAMGRPRFKRKGRSRDAFQVHGSTLRLVDGSHIQLPKIGVVKIPGKVRVGTWTDRNARTARRLWRLVRKDRARVVRATISRGASGVWWCSVTAEVSRDVPPGPSKRQQAAGVVGVDLGVKHLAVTSSGTTYANSRHLNAALADLKVAQRALSRCEKDSKRREKARRRVGTLHEQVALMRKDACDRITTELARGHAVVVVEGWDAQRLAQHGSDNVPKRLRADRNRALADAAPGIIRWQLEYKTIWSGSRLVKTDPGQPTGRTCSRCGQAKDKPVPPVEDVFRCRLCGHELDRRVNTARQLARVGRDGLGTVAVPTEPRGGDVRPATPRRGGRSPVKRDARTGPGDHRLRGRGRTGTPDP